MNIDEWVREIRTQHFLNRIDNAADKVSKVLLLLALLAITFGAGVAVERMAQQTTTARQYGGR